MMHSSTLHRHLERRITFLLDTLIVRFYILKVARIEVNLY